MKENGLKESPMVRASRHLEMEVHTMASLCMVKRREIIVFIIGQTEKSILVHFEMVICMVMES